MNLRQKNVKVAAVQAAPVAFNLGESLKKLESLTEEAAKEAAELVVFPQVPQYHKCNPTSAGPVELMCRRQVRLSFQHTLGDTRSTQRLARENPEARSARYQMRHARVSS
jgi:hypothetical protein